MAATPSMRLTHGECQSCFRSCRFIRCEDGKWSRHNVRKVCAAGATGYLGGRLVAPVRAQSVPVMAILKDTSCETDQHTMNNLGATSSLSV